MKPLLNTLLLCLGLSVATLAMAEPGPHRHGQEGAGRLDNLAAGTQPSCCPTDGKAAATAPVLVKSAPSDAAPVLIPAQGARHGFGESCKTKGMAGEGGPGAGGKSCNRQDGGCCKKDGAQGPGQGKSCCRNDGHSGGGNCGRGGDAEGDDLRARLHHLERRLDLMQKILESKL